MIQLCAGSSEFLIVTLIISPVLWLWMQDDQIRQTKRDNCAQCTQATAAGALLEPADQAGYFWDVYLQDKKVRRQMVQKMSTATQNIPGGIGERRTMRQQLEAMVDQIETETVNDVTQPGGRLPGAFATLTTAIYKWEELHTAILKSYPKHSQERRDHELMMAMPPGLQKNEQMHKNYYKLAVSNPAAVAWYCAVRLELMLEMYVAVMSKQLGAEGVKGFKPDQLSDAVGKELFRNDATKELHLDALYVEEYGQVHDYYASFEWSSGGMVHIHIALWIAGSPRIDQVVSDRTTAAKHVHCHDVDFAEKITLDEKTASNVLATFFDRAYTEWNGLKAQDNSEARQPGKRSKMDKKEQRTALTPQSLSTAAKRLVLQPRLETELAGRCPASDDTKHYALTLNKLEFQQWLAQAQRKPEQFPFGVKAHQIV